MSGSGIESMLDSQRSLNTHTEEDGGDGHGDGSANGHDARPLGV